MFGDFSFAVDEVLGSAELALDGVEVLSVESGESPSLLDSGALRSVVEGFDASDAEGALPPQATANRTRNAGNLRQVERIVMDQLLLGAW
jgi:hypothetical protein